MDTIRCTSCQILQRVDARVCSYCGCVLSAEPMLAGRQDSLPPASHRAGHTFGLHPEDQPYQSSMLIAQRPSAEEKGQWGVQVDPERIVFPATHEMVALKARRDAVKLAGPRVFSQRTISSLLTIACVFFLLATSIIAFTLIGSHTTIATAVIQATPNALRPNDTFLLAGRGFSAHDQVSFFHDAHQLLRDAQGKPLIVYTDAHGSFSFQIQVPGDWNAGVHMLNVVDSQRGTDAFTSITILSASTNPPVLQLSQSDCRFPGAAPGIVSTQSVGLTNAGGSQISWTVASDQPWLSVAPGKGTFSGNQDVQVTVNRGDLAPQPYTGHLIFTQSGSDGTTLTLTVWMEVTPTPASLTISTTDMAYNASPLQDPGVQSFTLHNSGQQSVHWSNRISTDAAASWLSVTPTEDTLNPDESETLTVTAHSLAFPIGNYQGAIQFTGGTSVQVNVSMHIVAVGHLVASSSALNFTAPTGKVAAAQQITLQNSGGMALDWSGQATTADLSPWLQITPAHGSLLGGEQVPMTVTADAKGLLAGSYQGIVTVVASSGNSRQIAVSFVVSPLSSPTPTPPANPALLLQPASLNFPANKGSDQNTQMLTITNTSTGTYSWSVASLNATLLQITPEQGTLAPGQSIQVTATIDSSQLHTGTTTTIITIAETEPGIPTVQQQVPVNITAH